MTGEERRNEILEKIKNSSGPLPAKNLAESLGVSRQIIVSDIALLRALGNEILSTNRGYVLKKSKRCSRVFKVSHTNEQLEDEMNGIVDLGGEIVNVIVHHHVYGTMEAALHIRSRRDVQMFMKDIQSGKSSPLMTVTSNYHYHCIEADSESILDEIEEQLKKKNYLRRKNEYGNAT